MLLVPVGEGLEIKRENGSLKSMDRRLILGDREETGVSCQIDAKIVGRLVVFGDRMMRAKDVEEQFNQPLQERLKGSKS